ncbi:glycosyltransferase family 2 protein [Candidatus Woesearchaeota archaeon]|nr:glycosyltransferase family 2 protein [Candidatus Woesearchaeota archaeon]
MNLAYTLLVYVVWFLSTYFIVVFLLALFKNKKLLYNSINNIDNADTKTAKLPKVSIILPAYNEESEIENSIVSLTSIDYPKELLEVIVVNDGSTDKTTEIVKKYADGKKIILIDNEKNKGKAACLNQGILLANGEYIACMDADSVVPKGILKKTLPYFKNAKIGAVTVSVEVTNPKNFLQRIIQIEYNLGLSLFLKVFSFFDCIHVTPGPFSIYRKTLLDKIKGFDEKNITEDLEIAYRIHKSGYKIGNCMDTSVRTVTPNNLKGLYRQRRRWYSGALLTLWQHKDILFKRKAGIFGYFIPFNYALITLGLGLFLLSLYLTLSNIINHIFLYSLTNFNFFSNWSFEDFDFLAVSIFLFFGLSGILSMILLLIFGLNSLKNSPKKRFSMFFGYFVLFFLYQFFWLSSFFLVIFRRQVKWR